MKLELGKTYLDRQGMAVKIIKQPALDQDQLWVGRNSDGVYREYRSDGRHQTGRCHFIPLRDYDEDLVAEAPAIAPKPPLGIIPEQLWREARFWDLIRALHRYDEAETKNEVPQEWLLEIGELARKITVPQHVPKEL